jgi:hypothetical protein
MKKKKDDMVKKGNVWEQAITKSMKKKWHLGKNALELPGRVEDFYGIMGKLTQDEWRNLKAVFIDLAQARAGTKKDNYKRWGIFNSHFDPIFHDSENDADTNEEQGLKVKAAAAKKSN